MRKRSLCAAIAMAALAAGCTELVYARLPDRPVDTSFQKHFWTWQNGEQLTFAYKAFEDAGKVAICGARAASPGGGIHQRTFNDRAIGTLYLTLDDEILLNDISFFRRGRYVRNQAPDGSAACLRTGRPWSAAYAEQPPEMEAAKTRFVVYD